MNERSERLARVLSVPLLIAALLTIPVLVIEQAHANEYQSFPSGHTSVSFAAAATLQNRYG